jgi:hypothetical protein
MKKVVKIIPHHGGKPFDYDILTDRVILRRVLEKARKGRSNLVS